MKNRERNEENFEATKANPLSRFHLLSRLSLVVFSHWPSSFRLVLSRLGSPSESCEMPSKPPPIVRQLADSGLYRIRYIKYPSISHQVSSFFEVSACITLFETVIENILDAWILDSEARNLDRLHSSLLPFLF